VSLECEKHVHHKKEKERSGLSEGQSNILVLSSDATMNGMSYGSMPRQQDEAVNDILLSSWL